MDDKPKLIVIGSSGVTNKDLLMTETLRSLSVTGGVELIPSDIPKSNVFQDDVLAPFFAPLHEEISKDQTEEIEEKPWQHNPVKTPWLERHVNRGYKKKR